MKIYTEVKNSFATLAIEKSFEKSDWKNFGKHF